MIIEKKNGVNSLVYFVLVSLFIIFYAVIFVSLLKSEGFSILSFAVDVLILIGLISFYFIGGRLEGHDLSNFLMFTHLGSYIYMYFAIKHFWVKPRLLKYIIHKDQNPESEELDFQELDLQTARIRAIYYFILSIVLLTITKLNWCWDWFSYRSKSFQRWKICNRYC
ncbi:DUF5080 family protein [Mammaliicoccus sciuri]|nr:hypothetical protein BU597_12675 [Staphylococcus arlettae]RIO11047.1 DUF5080 family protein [Mammaliicoccus sciuri]